MDEALVLPIHEAARRLVDQRDGGILHTVFDRRTPRTDNAVSPDSKRGIDQG
ncbi:hypothetical protein [Rhodoblastus sp.]|uniref:hypothetical protein n=1 Tax=Rhodoblastus sp. TaxID=1962975 RepID=UPI003F959F2B